MDKTTALQTYKSLSQPPRSALKTITGGKLNGKTDINPQWRYEAMTQTFGLVGIGWKYEINKLWTEDGANGEKLAFAQVSVYIKDGENWSEPIIGIGGSRLIAREKSGLSSNDEGYKMAVTDAFSTSLKMLGVAADIYAGRWDGSKYRDAEPTPTPTPTQYRQNPQAMQNPQPQQPAQFMGGPNTPQESAELNRLCMAVDATGQRIFSHDEIVQFQGYRTQMTAAQLIGTVRQSLKSRYPQAKELA